MTGRYRLTPEAQGDLDTAAAWYGKRSAIAAQGFLLAAKATFERVAEHPDHAPEIVSGTRRRNLNRYPFGIWYVKRPYGALVIGVLHHRLPQDLAMARSAALRP